MTPRPITTRPSQDALAAFVAETEILMPDCISQDLDVRARHANSEAWMTQQLPDLVVRPRTRENIVGLVKLAERYRVPLIPFGGGTSLEGHVNAPLGGASVDMTAMDRILDINASDRTARVEAGVSRKALNENLRDLPVFFSVDPGAEMATIGGLAATRASGTNTVRYGTMRDNVLSVEAVLSDASVIETATSAPKSAAGYDLTNLLIGSEGTLGLITELTLRLHPRPKDTGVAVAAFQSVSDACHAVIETLAADLKPARIELLDTQMMLAINQHSGTDLPEQPTLFVEFHGQTGEPAGTLQAFQAIAERHDVSAIEVAFDKQKRRVLWSARHDAYRAYKATSPDLSVFATDICVPISRLAEAIAQAQKTIARLGLSAPILGHVGDGNFHVLPAFDPSDPDQLSAVQHLVDDLTSTALALGGTCSGEHGIGQRKMEALEREAGTRLHAMRTLKRAFDPSNIFNPGKMFVL